MESSLFAIFYRKYYIIKYLICIVISISKTNIKKLLLGLKFQVLELDEQAV
jgi:hypothetical protein